MALGWFLLLQRQKQGNAEQTPKLPFLALMETQGIVGGAALKSKRTTLCVHQGCKSTLSIGDSWSSSRSRSRSWLKWQWIEIDTPPKFNAALRDSAGSRSCERIAHPVGCRRLPSSRTKQIRHAHAAGNWLAQVRRNRWGEGSGPGPPPGPRRQHHHWRHLS